VLKYALAMPSPRSFVTESLGVHVGCHGETLNVYRCGESGGVLIICDGTVIEGGEGRECKQSSVYYTYTAKRVGHVFRVKGGSACKYFTSLLLDEGDYFIISLTIAARVILS